MNRKRQTICLTLESIPIRSRPGKSLGSKSNGLINFLSFRCSEDLKENSTHGILRSITSNEPRQRVIWEKQPRSIFQCFLEPLEMSLIIERSSAWIPIEPIVGHLIELGTPFRIIRYVMVEKESSAKKTLHIFRVGRKRDIIDGLLAILR